MDASPIFPGHTDKITLVDPIARPVALPDHLVLTHTECNSPGSGLYSAYEVAPAFALVWLPDSQSLLKASVALCPARLSDSQPRSYPEFPVRPPQPEPSLDFWAGFPIIFMAGRRCWFLLKDMVQIIGEDGGKHSRPGGSPAGSDDNGAGVAAGLGLRSSLGAPWLLP